MLSVVRNGVEYKVNEPDSLRTPCLVAFEPLVKYNIGQMCDLAGGAENLAPHVKTHKSRNIAHLQIQHGITSFKTATVEETRIALEAGAQFVLQAFPIANRPTAKLFCNLVENFPDATVCGLVSAKEHVIFLRREADERMVQVPVMLDINLGQNRTGRDTNDEILQLYQLVSNARRLTPMGLHAYDGHQHILDPHEREQAANRNIEKVFGFRGLLITQGHPVPMIIGGGSFSFPYFARTEGALGSPGTTVYWDPEYERQMPDRPFRCALAVITTVVDRYDRGPRGESTITLDAGNKSIAPDRLLQKRMHILGLPEGGVGTLTDHTEQHAVVRLENCALPKIGDQMLILPGHVCTTVNLHDGTYLVDEQGSIAYILRHDGRAQL